MNTSMDPNPNMTYEELREQLAEIIYGPIDGKDNIVGHIHMPDVEACIQLFATLCAELIESGRVDGMFIEWNGLNLADIKDMYAYLAQLTTKNTEEENV